MKRRNAVMIVGCVPTLEGHSAAGADQQFLKHLSAQLPEGYRHGGSLADFRTSAAAVPDPLVRDRAALLKSGWL